MSIRCMELITVTPQQAADIDRLHPNLLVGAERGVVEWINHLLESGTRILAALDGERIVGATLLYPMAIFTGQPDWVEIVVVDEDYC